MKVIVCYNDNDVDELRKTIRITIPKNWKGIAVPKVKNLLEEFINAYNKHYSKNKTYSNTLQIENVQIAVRKDQIVPTRKEILRKQRDIRGPTESFDSLASLEEEIYIPLDINASIADCIKNHATVFIRHIKRIAHTETPLTPFVAVVSNNNGTKSIPKLRSPAILSTTPGGVGVTSPVSALVPATSSSFSSLASFKKRTSTATQSKSYESEEHEDDDDDDEDDYDDDEDYDDYDDHYADEDEEGEEEEDEMEGPLERPKERRVIGIPGNTQTEVLPPPHPQAAMLSPIYNGSNTSIAGNVSLTSKTSSTSSRLGWMKNKQLPLNPKQQSSDSSITSFISDRSNLYVRTLFSKLKKRSSTSVNKFTEEPSPGLLEPYLNQKSLAQNESIKKRVSFGKHDMNTINEEGETSNSPTYDEEEEIFVSKAPADTTQQNNATDGKGTVKMNDNISCGDDYIDVVRTVVNEQNLKNYDQMDDNSIRKELQYLSKLLSTMEGSSSDGSRSTKKDVPVTNTSVNDISANGSNSNKKLITTTFGASGNVVSDKNRPKHAPTPKATNAKTGGGKNRKKGPADMALSNSSSSTYDDNRTYRSHTSSANNSSVVSSSENELIHIRNSLISIGVMADSKLFDDVVTDMLFDLRVKVINNGGDITALYPSHNIRKKFGSATCVDDKDEDEEIKKQQHEEELEYDIIRSNMVQMIKNSVLSILETYHKESKERQQRYHNKQVISKKSKLLSPIAPTTGNVIKVNPHYYAGNREYDDDDEQQPDSVTFQDEVSPDGKRTSSRLQRTGRSYPNQQRLQSQNQPQQRRHSLDISEIFVCTNRGSTNNGIDDDIDPVLQPKSFVRFKDQIQTSNSSTTTSLSTSSVLKTLFCSAE